MINEIKMLTDKTQKAIGILHEIAYYGTRTYSDKGLNMLVILRVQLFWDSCGMPVSYVCYPKNNRMRFNHIDYARNYRKYLCFNY